MGIKSLDFEVLVEMFLLLLAVLGEVLRRLLHPLPARRPSPAAARGAGRATRPRRPPRRGWPPADRALSTAAHIPSPPRSNRHRPAVRSARFSAPPSSGEPAPGGADPAGLFAVRAWKRSRGKGTPQAETRRPECGRPASRYKGRVSEERPRSAASG